MMNFSPEKLFLVGIIALMVLGPHRLPNAARSLGRFVVEMRRMSSSLQSEVRDALAEPGDTLTSGLSETGLTDVPRSVHDGVSGLRESITSAVWGEATSGSRIPNPSPPAPPTSSTGPRRAPGPRGPLAQLTLTFMTAVDDPAKAATEPTHDGPGTMTLVEHLGELRRRLLICILAVAVATVAAWFFYDQLVGFMRTPYCTFVHHHPNKSISGCNLVTTGPVEGFTTRLKVSAYAGIAVATPVWLWELWRFITPGLHKNEKRYIVPFVASAVALFALGVTTAILVFPKALDWLISVSGQRRRAPVLPEPVLHPLHGHGVDLRPGIHVPAGTGVPGAGRRGAEQDLATVAAAGDRRDLRGGGRDHTQQRPVLVHRHGRPDAAVLRGIHPARAGHGQIGRDVRQTHESGDASLPEHSGSESVRHSETDPSER